MNLPKNSGAIEGDVSIKADSARGCEACCDEMRASSDDGDLSGVGEIEYVPCGVAPAVLAFDDGSCI